jgi:hypothetical protein
MATLSSYGYRKNPDPFWVPPFVNSKKLLGSLSLCKTCWRRKIQVNCYFSGRHRGGHFNDTPLNCGERQPHKNKVVEVLLIRAHLFKWIRSTSLDAIAMGKLGLWTGIGKCEFCFCMLNDIEVRYGVSRKSIYGILPFMIYRRRRTFPLKSVNILQQFQLYTYNCTTCYP